MLEQQHYLGGVPALCLTPDISGRGRLAYGDYRLYFMNRFSGHIERFEEIEAPGDRDACDLAARHVGEEPLELWCGHRKVHRFEAEDAHS